MASAQEEPRRHPGAPLPQAGRPHPGRWPCAWRALAGAVLAFAACAGASTAAAQGPGDGEWVMGGLARVASPVQGDVTAMGGMVDVAAAVAGDVRAAGGNVRVGAAVDGSVMAAGGRVDLLAPVGGDVRVAGGDVVLSPSAAVDGDVSLAGGTVRVAGPVSGRVRAAGGTVHIDGLVRGDVEVNAGALRLGPEARIEGALRYATRDPLQRHALAQVEGPIEQREWRGDRWSGPWWMAWPQHEMGAHRGWGVWRVGGWLWTGVLLLLAALVASAAPRLSRASAATLDERPLASLVVGLALLLGVPLAALLLFVTLIGIPFGLLVLALYPLMLLAGYVVAAVALGGLVLQRWRPGAAVDPGWRVAAALLAMTALALAGRLPAVGGLIAALAVLAGLGVLWLQWRGGSRPPPGPNAAPAATAARSG
jgi:cytoskeletal protein CcmA (bactofilin family)